MIRKSVLPLTAVSAFAISCAMPVEVEYAVIAALPKLEIPVDEPDPIDLVPQTIDLDEAPAPPTQEELEAAAAAAEAQAEAAESVRREDELAAIRSAIGKPGDGKGVGGQRITFTLPRSLVLIGTGVRAVQTAGGTQEETALSALSVPSDAPLRTRVFQDVADLEEMLEAEETLEEEVADAEAPPEPIAVPVDEDEPPAPDAAPIEGVDSEELPPPVDEPVFRPFDYVERALPVYGMRQVGGTSGWTGEGALQVSYFQNSRIIASVGRELAELGPTPQLPTSSNLIALANTAPVYFSNLPQPEGDVEPTLPPFLPTAIDVQFYLDETTSPENGDHEWLPLPFNDGWSYKIDLYSPPADSFDRETFFTEVVGQRVNVLPVSACRNATLYIVQDVPENLEQKEDVTVDFSPYINERSFHQFHLTVADISRVQVVPLPVGDGQVVMHTSCGADLRMDDYRAGPERAMISDAALRARAILDGWQKVLRR